MYNWCGDGILCSTVINIVERGLEVSDSIFAIVQSLQCKDFAKWYINIYVHYSFLTLLGTNYAVCLPGAYCRPVDR